MMKSGRNDLLEFHPIKKLFLPAYSGNRSRQVKQKVMDVANAPRPRLHTKPNDLGNYAGKRTPKERPEPLSPEQRFSRLVAAFQAVPSPVRGGSQPRKPKGVGLMKRGFRVHSCNKLRYARRVAEAKLLAA